MCPETRIPFNSILRFLIRIGLKELLFFPDTLYTETYIIILKDKYIFLFLRAYCWWCHYGHIINSLILIK